MEFEWDYDKENKNFQKHRIMFTESVETFYDLLGFKLIDCSHSENELRFYWVGKSKSGRVLTTWYTERNLKIRIIGSAEWRKLRKLYYERAKAKKPPH